MFLVTGPSKLATVWFANRQNLVQTQTGPASEVWVQPVPEPEPLMWL